MSCDKTHRKPKVLTKRHTCLAHPPPRSKSLDRSLHCYRHGMPYMDAPAQSHTTENADDLRLRRTVLLERADGSYGFTLQSYGIQYGHSDGEVEVLTYVDFVDENGVAFKAGLRTGDVILSINGTDVEKSDHKDLVAQIRNSTRLRMVVLYEDCARRVDLHMRYITLTQKLQFCVNEFKQLCKKEKQILVAAQRRSTRRSKRDKPSNSQSPCMSPHMGFKLRPGMEKNASAPSTLDARCLSTPCSSASTLSTNPANSSIGHSHGHSLTVGHHMHQNNLFPHYQTFQGAHKQQSRNDQYFPKKGVLKRLMKAKLEEKAASNGFKSPSSCWNSCHDVTKNPNGEEVACQTCPTPPPYLAPSPSIMPPPPPPPHVTNRQQHQSRSKHRHHHHHSSSHHSQHERHHYHQHEEHKHRPRHMFYESSDEDGEGGEGVRPRSSENLVAAPGDARGRRKERACCGGSGTKTCASCGRSKSFSSTVTGSSSGSVSGTSSFSLKINSGGIKATSKTTTTRSESKRWSVSMTRPKTVATLTQTQEKESYKKLAND